MAEAPPQEAVLEGGTYEIIRKRLQEHGAGLRGRLDTLNAARKEVFGSIEPKLLATERITTANNCTPRGLAAIGSTFIFGYNVQFGLKSTTELADVFSVYELKERTFEARDLTLISDPQFLVDFQNLYKYYKQTFFTRFYRNGPHLFMVFRIGKSITDVKTFKWLITPENTLRYIDNRSDHEYKYPVQHEFEWKRTNRDYHRQGKHPHISIDDRLFIEAIGGDLTLKIEDNTETGEGIYAEPVSEKEQKLDDAEILYSIVGPLILLKVRPYREEKYRYIIYNEKVRQAIRIDDIGNACALLPDHQGLIFPSGFYLVSGEYKKFDYDSTDMVFERRIPSPNGEDTLYVFFNRDLGLNVLLSYNIIEQTTRTPVLCHGFSHFRQGEMLFFRAEQEPQRHHSVQIWQTPYTSPEYQPPARKESFLYNIGNKDLVRCMAECQNIINLVRREDSYAGLYEDILKASNVILDTYFWVSREESQNLAASLTQIRDTAGSAIDEFEKVRRIRKTTAERLAVVQKSVRALLDSIKPDLMARLDEYIGALASLRAARGEIIALRELRYIDLPAVEELEKNVVERSGGLATACIDFLVKPDALKPYEEKVGAVARDAITFQKTIEGKEIDERIGSISRELETMIEVVGSLKIEDPTKSTQIIDGCSNIFTQLNAARAQLRNRRKDLQSNEAATEFAAQLKLVDQSVVSYLDVVDTPQKCDEYLNKLLVQIEELEGRFAQFDDYVLKLADKRSEVSSALEARRVALVEEKSKRAAALHQAADRMLKTVQARADQMKTPAEIHAYFAGDMMVDKIRSLVTQLKGLDDTVKADEIESRLKSTQENAIRQLRDRQELFVGGENTIKFGKHAFTVNVQKTDLTILSRDGAMYFHVTGTNFYEEVKNAGFLSTKDLWTMEVLSEDSAVYRGEYLAMLVVRSAGKDGIPTIAEIKKIVEDDLSNIIRTFMSPRYEEGYTKGVHDFDATRIAKTIATLQLDAGTLRFSGLARSLARAWWHGAASKEEQARIAPVLVGIGRAIEAFPGANDFPAMRAELTNLISNFATRTGLFDVDLAEEAAAYLFDELCDSSPFVISPEAAHLHDEFLRHVREHHVLDEFEDSCRALANDFPARLALVRGWLRGFLAQVPTAASASALNEAATLLATGTFERGAVHAASTAAELTGLRGAHPRIRSGVMQIDYPEFNNRLRRFDRDIVPRFRQYSSLRKSLIDDFRAELRLNELQPKVLTSFVRNRLLDEVYLRLIGDNLAKQIGAAGAQKRTDLNGMLLLISPPGYGKTTLMEYIANRLGLIFMKVNGPALGHRVTSIDPAEAPNAAARSEIEKLNLGLEMGDNIMLYIDDIQHCNPEFLQKFISLCDAQRKIEGVWKGKSRNYDLRGRKVCVVMAGNPYTESGEKFQIPDMLANRADTYNLGDIIGDNSDAFELSYIENSLTSNSVLAPLAMKSRKDIYTLVRLAKEGPFEGAEFEHQYSAEETNDFVNILRKLLRIQEVVLKVNLEYIHSAAQADAYRTEPPFKLQGSYRNMNKLAEKVIPVMNDDELKTLILSHYEGESQTLTTGAESNVLKFLEMMGWQDDKQKARWDEIKKAFQRNQRMRGMDTGDAMTRAIVQLGDLTEGVGSIRESLAPLGSLADKLGGAGQEIARGFKEVMDNAPARQREVPVVPAPAAPPQPAPVIRFPERFSADLSQETIEKIAEVFAGVKLRLTAAELSNALEPRDPDAPKARGEFGLVGSMRECLVANGYVVDEYKPGCFHIHRDGGRPLDLKVRHDRLHVVMELPGGDRFTDAASLQKLLQLNAEIQPASFGLTAGPDGKPRLAILETREGRNLTRGELVEVLKAVEDAAAKAAQVFHI